MKYELGCSTWGGSVEGRMETVKLLAEVGFDRIMLPSFIEDPKELEKIVRCVRDLGMEIDEIHAPFKSINHIWYDDPSCDNILEELLLCVDRCADNEVTAMVVHDSSGRIGPDTSMAGLNRFRKLYEYANEKGVAICMENIRRTNHLGRIFHENRDIPLYYCWDSGHELCYTPGVDHLALFGEKLRVTHIHDNVGVFMSDDHMLPFDGNLNWEKKARLIKECGYTGALTLELNRSQAKYADISDKDFAKEAYKRIQKFAKMCE